MNLKDIRDHILGTILGVIFVIIIAKLLHADMTILDILKLIFRLNFPIWW
ncbi:MAG: hypothetical protein ACTSW1_09230 [Candidatus Hodarchaeales archaeon]